MNMITKEHNYDNGYIGLVDLELEGMPETVDVKGDSLFRKTEFHISLLCVKRIAALIDETRSAAVEKELVNEFLNFTKVQALVSYGILPELRVVERDERKTLVVMTQVPGLGDFFAQLEEKYKIELPLQPTHITLYALQPEAGIGILSNEQLASDSQIVDMPELAVLKK